jgi:hypothetical protein
MTKYLITFPSGAMDLTGTDIESVGRESRAVIVEAQAAGVYVFGGGIDEDVAPVRVHGDGSVTEGGYRPLDGGFTVLELPSREEAERWAAKIAAACRCPQELREFMYDPLS